jgi:hypothetical protein
MRFNCSRQNPTEWHVWFAWHPVRLANGCVWLENLERRGTKRTAIAQDLDPDVYGMEYEYWDWEYRR